MLAAHTAVANGVLVLQHDLELLLGEYCARLGVQVRRGVEVRGVHGTGADLADDADVVVETSAGDIAAGWVVAADGGRSVIRRQLGDAVNLGWKLAATIAGWAPAGLLDTYQTERHPIAEWVLNWTRAQVALLRGDEWTAQLRHVVADELFTVPGAMNRVVMLSAGIAQHYDVADPDPAGPVGSTAGDVELTSGQRLADFAHDGRFVLVDRSPDGQFAAAARPLEPRLTYVPDPEATWI